MPQFVVGFSAVDKSDMDLVGQHGAELGELARLMVPISPGFIITWRAYEEFVRHNNLDQKIKHLTNAGLFSEIKKHLNHSVIPEHVGYEIAKAYRRLGSSLKDAVVGFGAVKNIKSEIELLMKVREAWLKNPGPIVVQTTIINPRLSGDLWTQDEKGKIKITVKTSPKSLDIYEVSKRTSDVLFKAIGKNTRQSERLTDSEIRVLAKVAALLDRYFYFPKEVAWAIEDGKIYITQVKPANPKSETRNPKPSRTALLKGKSFGRGIHVGPVRFVHHERDLERISSQEILIASHAHPQFAKHGRSLVINDMKHAAKMIRNGYVVTLNALTGEVFKGGM